MSRSPLDIDDLVEHWTLLPDELDLVVRLHEPSRLKFYTRHGRFSPAAAASCTTMR